MKLKQYQIDAFAERAFEGNPAAVCPLESWLDDRIMQAIAEENNLSETAFLVPSGNCFDLRWFTPVSEVDLCGHATLAAAHVLFDILGYAGRTITFATRSGDLSVERQGRLLAMDFPATRRRPAPSPRRWSPGSAGNRSRCWRVAITWRCSTARPRCARSRPIMPG